MTAEQFLVFSFFVNLSLCVCLLVSACTSICKYILLFFCLNVCQLLCLWVLFFFVAATWFLLFYFLSVFTSVVSFNFVTSLFLSIIAHLLFHFFICPLGGLGELFKTMSSSGMVFPNPWFIVSTHYFLFVLYLVTFYFCLF